MFQPRFLLLSSSLSCLLLSGCQTLGTAPSASTQASTQSNGSGINKTVAQVGGGLLGGLVGNQFGGGNGNTLMTIAGAIGGAYLGGELLGDENKSAQTQPVAQAKPAIAKTQADPTLNKYCHKRIKYHKDVPVEVDVAYIRYKRNFGYMTKDESIRARGYDPATAAEWVTQMDNGYRHVVQPGVRYLMKEAVDLDTGYYIGWLSLELEKSGKEKTRVYVNYCEGGQDGFDPKYSKVIRKKVDNGYI